MKVTRSNRKIVLSVLMALMIALAMMPGMAFASSQVPANDNGAAVVAADSIAIAPLTTNVYVGDQKTMSAAVDTTIAPYHVEWSSSNKSVATISKKNAKLLGLSAGTTTITATLLTGTEDATDATVLATDSINVTVLATETYGFQGTGGNTMMMLSPSDITVREIGKDAGGNIEYYDNVINTTVTKTDNTYVFGFTLSAGVNIFDRNNFVTNSLPNITVTDIEGNPIPGASVSVPTTGYFDAATKTIYIHVKGISAGTYTLEFGSDVCGNNTSKKLGVPVYFEFTAQ